MRLMASTERDSAVEAFLLAAAPRTRKPRSRARAFLVLFGLGGLATIAQSEAVLPAYLVGLVVAGTFMHNRVLMDRMRSTSFALLTPFYFLKAGALISLPVPVTATGAGLVLLFFLTKMVTKIIGIRPLTRPFGLAPRLGNYTTLLMATGLTLGSISALFGYTHGYITHTEYTILSAVVPTMFAQGLFRPRLELGEAGAITGIPAEPLPSAEDRRELEEVAGALDE
jgi:Kef-type K+ transport system membrane component KefB